MKTFFCIYTFSFLFAVQSALAGGPMSSMSDSYDEQAKMCLKTKENYAANAAATADPEGWLLSLAPRKEKAMLASCCTEKKEETQANAR